MATRLFIYSKGKWKTHAELGEMWKGRLWWLSTKFCNAGRQPGMSETSHFGQSSSDSSFSFLVRPKSSYSTDMSSSSSSKPEVTQNIIPEIKACDFLLFCVCFTQLATSLKKKKEKSNSMCDSEKCLSTSGHLEYKTRAGTNIGKILYLVSTTLSILHFSSNPLVPIGYLRVSYSRVAF